MLDSLTYQNEQMFKESKERKERSEGMSQCWIDVRGDGNLLNRLSGNEFRIFSCGKFGERSNKESKEGEEIEEGEEFELLGRNWEVVHGIEADAGRIGGG